MLSHEELRRLAQIERGLELDDPAFARRLRRLRTPRDPRPLSAALLVLGMAGLFGGLLLNDVTTVLVIGVLPLVVWAVRHRRR